MKALMPLFAVTNVREWGIQEWLIAIVAIAAAVGIAIVALKVFEVKIPWWFQKILLIVLCAVVAIIAIRIVFTL